MERHLFSHSDLIATQEIQAGDNAIRLRTALPTQLDDDVWTPWHLECHHGVGQVPSSNTLIDERVDIHALDVPVALGVDVDEFSARRLSTSPVISLVPDPWLLGEATLARDLVAWATSVSTELQSVDYHHQCWFTLILQSQLEVISF